MKSICSLVIGVGLLGWVSLSQAERGYIVLRLDSTQQAIQAEIVVVGRIVEMEDGDYEATTHPGNSQKTAYKIANIQIKEALVGAKGLTHIRVGFIPMPPQQNTNNKIIVDEIDGNYPVDTYGINDGGCFFLQKHHEGNFYIPLQYGNRIDSKQDKYEVELEKIKRMIWVFEKPLESLKARTSEDRQFAAWALLIKYKSTPRNAQKLKEEEIPKEESRLILKALSEMDSNSDNPDPSTHFTVLFSMLQLTDRDGWKELKLEGKVDSNKSIKDAFDQWYKTHGEKYCLKKYVVSKK